MVFKEVIMWVVVVIRISMREEGEVKDITSMC